MVSFSCAREKGGQTGEVGDSLSGSWFLTLCGDFYLLNSETLAVTVLRYGRVSQN